MNLKDEFQKQVHIADWINQNFSISLPAENERTLIFVGCFDLTIEHHDSICILFESGRYGSMYALLRSVFESYARGLFFRYSATQKEIDLFKKDKFDIEFKELVCRIENSVGMTNKVLLNFKNAAWKTLNSFTHTGFQHIIRRHLNGSTGPINYLEHELIEVLQNTGSFSLLAALELATLSENPELINLVLDKTRSYASNN